MILTNFLVTAYLATGHPAADGKMPVAGRTCAAPAFVPLGSYVIVQGKRWTVTDRTAKRFRYDRVDLYFGKNKKAALKWGARHLTVAIISTK